MSWADRLKTGLKITTGDGKVYTPFSPISTNTKSFDFNISEFHFPEVAGTKVDRRLHKGTRYPLEFYFQGEDNIDQSDVFEKSSKDTRPWTILHPIYGQFIAHPLSIEFDNSGVNTTKITCTVVETITQDGPRTTKDVKGSANQAIESDRQSNLITAATVQPSVSDVVTMQSTSRQMYDVGAVGIKDEITASKYFNLYSKATNKINNALNNFNTAVTFIQDFIIYPAQFLIDVKSRFKILKAQALKLSDILDQYNDFGSKKIFESQKGAIVSSAIETSLNPIGNDYQSAIDVLYIIEELLGLYNGFIDELNSLQTPDGTQVDSYLPDAQFMYDLNFSVNFAVSNLFNIALSAQQERVISLEHDSNVVIQAHRFYGLTANDETIQRFIDTNDIQLKELLQLKKGRKLLYYI